MESAKKSCTPAIILFSPRPCPAARALAHPLARFPFYYRVANH